MKTTALIIISIFLFTKSFSQNANNIQIEKNLKYYYPEFYKGKIQFVNGKKADSKLNYDLLNEEMHFINSAGDTLALSNMGEIKEITIGDDLFYYKNGFLKVVVEMSNIKLASKQKRSTEVIGMKGAYGEKLDGSSVANYTNLMTKDFAAIKLKTGNLGYGDLAIDYYISGPENNFILANRKNFYKLMPNKKDLLNEFFKKNEIDFSNQTDLIKFMAYVNENQ